MTVHLHRKLIYGGAVSNSPGLSIVGGARVRYTSEREYVASLRLEGGVPLPSRFNVCPSNFAPAYSEPQAATHRWGTMRGD